jgi:hypothetical protein
MKRSVPIIFAILTIALVALGSVHSKSAPANTPDGAVQGLFGTLPHNSPGYGAAKPSDYSAALSHVANADKIDKAAFIANLTGRDGSLRTYSALDKVDTSVLFSNANEALVRTVLVYYSAVGTLRDTRDLKVVRQDGEWKVVWPLDKHEKVPPQVIAVNYLRWDVIPRGADDDWGAQDVASPKVRITSMNAVQHDDDVVVLGEVVNDDTVPGFTSVNATLLGKDAGVLGEESSFDKMSHTLLPKEVSPFRIDFPNTRLSDVKSVRMQPMALLVNASADPVIGVLHQRMENDSLGRHVLKGELTNESGRVVNIPHVLATFYDRSGKVIWVNDGYVDKALQPDTPVPFAVNVDNDLGEQIQSYRVTVTAYSLDWAKEH